MPSECPSWLTETCPPWCQADHQEQIHPDDRYHQSRPILVPAVVPKPVTGGEVSATSGLIVEPDEMAVLALRPVGQVAQVWVAIVGERQFLEVSVESAVRLHAALEEILDEVR